MTQISPQESDDEEKPITVGELPPDRALEVVLVAPRRRLPPDHPLHGLIAELLDTGRLRRPLTPSELQEVRGINPVHIEDLTRFCVTSGLTVLEDSIVRGDVVVRGTAHQLNALFGIELRQYRDPHGRLYHGHPDTPRHPEPIKHALRGVLGLHATPLTHRPPRHPLHSEVPDHQLVGPRAVEERYRFPRSPEKPVGRVALLEMAGGYYVEDLELFRAGASEGIRDVPVPGGMGPGSNNPMSRQRLQAFASAWSEGDLPSDFTKAEFLEFVNTIEVTMDLELIRGLAPSAPVDVYFAPPGGDGWWRSLWAVLGHPVGGWPKDISSHVLPTVLSISWGDAESSFSPLDLELIDETIQALVLSGVTVCCSSGDHGSSGGAKAPAVQSHFPASSPHALAVGGTHWTNPMEPGTTSEIAWRTEFHEKWMATGGGMSGVFGEPSYQGRIAELPLPGTWRSDQDAPERGRWIPDVAALGDFQLSIVVGGHTIPGGGTSAATPIWAALLWRISENLGERIGPVHHAFYGSRPDTVLKSITMGSNDVTNVGGYEAGPGWDACTGLGTPDGAALERYLASLGTHRLLELHPRLGAWRIPGEGVVLLAERGEHILCGDMYDTIVGALERGASDEQLRSLLHTRHRPEEVSFALARLRSIGAFLVSGHDATRHPERLGPLPPLTTRGPSAKRLEVELEILGGLSPEGAAEELAKAGVTCRPKGQDTSPAALRLVLADDFLVPDLAEVNALALRSGGAWVLAKPVGEVVWLSPIMRPGETACWSCMADPIARNRGVARWVRDRLELPGIPSPPQPTTAHSLRLGLRWIARHLPGMLGEAEDSETQRPTPALRTHDLATRVTRRHPVRRRPECGQCGDAGLIKKLQGAAPRLEARPRGPWSDGGFRTRAPGEVVKELMKLVDPVTGVVSECEPVIVRATEELHVYLAGGNPGSGFTSLYELRSGLRSHSAGKGKSADQAKASALGEAVERHSATFRGDEPTLRASFKSLGSDAIHPNRCMGYSDWQMENRDVLNRSIRERPHLRLEGIPPALDPTEDLDWTKVWSIDGHESRYLPTMFLYYGYPAGPHANYCPGDSNGCAAGSSLEEAVLQGALELVERDAVGIWWYNQVPRPTVNLDSVDDPWVATIRSAYSRLGRDLWVLDLTTDVGIPVFAAVTRLTDAPTEDLLFGFGAHVDPTVAVTRSITEVNQMVAQEVRETGHHSRQDPLGHWLDNATLQEHSFLAPTRGLTSLDIHPNPLHHDLRDDIHYVGQKLAERGLEMFFLDQTRPGLGLSAARVVVPGLRHFRPRFGSGRLFDVPVGLGWLEAPKKEHELNPIPFLL